MPLMIIKVVRLFPWLLVAVFFLLGVTTTHALPQDDKEQIRVQKHHVNSEHKRYKKHAKGKKWKQHDRVVAQIAKKIGLTEKQYKALEKHQKKFGKQQRKLRWSLKKAEKQLNEELKHPYPDNKNLKKYRKTRDKLLKNKQKLETKIANSLRRFLSEAQALQFQKEMAKHHKTRKHPLKKMQRKVRDKMPMKKEG